MYDDQQDKVEPEEAEVETEEELIKLDDVVVLVLKREDYLRMRDVIYETLDHLERQIEEIDERKERLVEVLEFE